MAMMKAGPSLALLKCKGKPGNDESRAKPGYDESRAKPGLIKAWPSQTVVNVFFQKKPFTTVCCFGQKGVT